MIGSSSSQQTIPKKRAKIQLISFIAVVFLLFATFAMFALTLEKKSNIPLDSPGCWGWGDPSNPPVVLQVTDAGLYWDKELITQRELPERLAKYAANNKNPRILLAGDDHAKYGTTVETLDEIHKAGITQVQVETVYRGTGQ